MSGLLQKDKMVIGLFIFLQSARLYELLFLDYIFLKWLLIDLIFLVFIPKPKFITIVTSLLLLTNALYSPHKSPSFKDKVTGSATIRVQPWSSVSLSSNGCINQRSSDKLQTLSLKCNGVGPWVVSILHNKKNGWTVKTSKEQSLISISEIGVYEIEKALDGNNLLGRIDSDAVEIDHCPYAEFTVKEEGICKNSELNLPIKLYGEPPYQLTMVSGGETIILDTDKGLSVKNPKSSYIMSSIKDTKGNVYKYLENEQKLNVLLYDPPSASWIKNETKLLIGVKSTQSKILLSGTPPFNITILDHKKSQIKIKNIQDSSMMFEISKIGEYTIQNISDMHGIQNLSEKLNVITPMKPALSLKKTLIGDSFQIDFLLQGEGPWTIVTNSKGSLESKSTTHLIKNPSHRIKWTPKQPGENIFSFLVSDTNYKRVPHPETINHYIEPKESVLFDTTQDGIICCLGEEKRIKLRTEGVFPQKILYEITFPDKSKVNGELIDKKKEIVISSLQKTGRYSIVLLHDDKPAYHIDVKARPTASLKTDAKIYQKKENEEIGIPVLAEGTDDISITLKNGKSKIKKKIIDSKILIKDPGIYELVDVSDKYCSNILSGKISFIVKNYPMPIIKFSDTNKSTVCYSNDIILLKLIGEIPISITYDEVFKGITTRSELKLNSVDQIKNNMFKLKLPNHRKPGDYTYNIINYSDKNYSLSSNEKSPISLCQTVLSPPTISLSNKETTKKTGISLSLDGIPPFKVKYEIEDKKEEITLTKKTSTLLLDLTPGDKLLKITNIVDGMGCVNLSPIDLLFSVLQDPEIKWLGSVFCQGKQLQLTLIGLGPWILNLQFYDKDGHFKRKRNLTVFTPSIDILLEMAGHLIITISTEKCSSRTYRFNIRDSPSAILNNGKDTVEYIREGEKISLPLKLTGVPPFSITYRRIYGEHVEVLSMENIQKYDTTIEVNKDGKFEIISVRDKECDRTY